MADSARSILIQFVTDVRDLERGFDEVEGGIKRATTEMSNAEKVTQVLGKAAKTAALAAAEMAAEWAIAGIDIATEANKIAANFEAVTGATGDLDYAIEELAGHMGLAEYQAQALLADASALAQSMGAGQAEANAFAEAMFRAAGDMAAFNPEAGNAEDAMAALLKAANGSTRSLQAWDISLKSGEITARALADTGKTLASELTSQEKAAATLALATEKMGEAQGTLNEKMESGSTEVKEAKADIADMQVQVGNALMPIRKLALQGFLILADVLTALEPAIVAIGDVLSVVMEILAPLIDLVRILADLLGQGLSRSVEVLKRALDPLLGLLQRVSSAISTVVAKIPQIKLPSLPSWVPRRHAGGTVPGARGSEQLVMAQGGERIVPPGESMRGGGGGGGGPTTVVNVTVQAGISSPMDTARAIADLLGEYSVQSGGLDVRIRERS